MYNSSLHVLDCICKLRTSYTLPETAPTENKYEQMEVNIYIWLIPTHLSLYFCAEYTSNTLPETASTENKYEQIEVNISYYSPLRVLASICSLSTSITLPETSHRERIWTERWTYTYDSSLHVVASIYTLSILQIFCSRQLPQRMNMNR